VSDIEHILADAEVALLASRVGDAQERQAAMNCFMTAFERVARRVAQGESTWADVHPWAVRNAFHLIDAFDELEQWSEGTATVFYRGGEEATEQALERRSKLEIVRDAFGGTVAEEWLRPFGSGGMDQEYREYAHGFGLDPPDWVPPSHTWWRWRTK
jgi:hypothetical protein